MNSNSIAKEIEKQTGLKRSTKEKKYAQECGRGNICYGYRFAGYRYSGDFHIINEYGEVYELKFDSRTGKDKQAEVVDVLKNLGCDVDEYPMYLRIELEEDLNKWYGSNGHYRKGKWRLWKKSYPEDTYCLSNSEDENFKYEFTAYSPSSAKSSADYYIEQLGNEIVSRKVFEEGDDVIVKGVEREGTVTDRRGDFYNVTLDATGEKKEKNVFGGDMIKASLGKQQIKDVENIFRYYPELTYNEFLDGVSGEGDEGVDSDTAEEMWNYYSQLKESGYTGPKTYTLLIPLKQDFWSGLSKKIWEPIKNILYESSTSSTYEPEDWVDDRAVVWRKLEEEDLIKVLDWLKEHYPNQQIEIYDRSTVEKGDLSNLGEDVTSEFWTSKIGSSRQIRSSFTPEQIKQELESSDIEDPEDFIGIDFNINEEDISTFAKSWIYSTNKDPRSIASVQYDPNRYETVDGAYIVTYKDGSVETWGWNYSGYTLKYMNTNHNRKAVASRYNRMDNSRQIKSSKANSLKDLTINGNIDESCNFSFAHTDDFRVLNDRLNGQLTKIEKKTHKCSIKESEKILEQIVNEIESSTELVCEEYLFDSISLGYKLSAHFIHPVYRQNDNYYLSIILENNSKQIASRYYMDNSRKFTLSEVAQYLSSLFFDLRTIHFNTTGSEFYTYHTLAEELYEKTEDYYDDIVETAITFDHDVSPMYVLPGDWMFVEEGSDFGTDDKSVQTMILERLKIIYDVLENVTQYDSMVQSKIDSMMEYYNKEIYKLTQALK